MVNSLSLTGCKAKFAVEALWDEVLVRIIKGDKSHRILEVWIDRYDLLSNIDSR